jgi:Arm domain-containing DNA-binding protein
MPKMRTLTSAFIRRVKPPSMGQIEYPDGACQGLRLRLSQGGSATWVLRCRDATGSSRRFTLGRLDELGLSAAREAGRQLRHEVRQGRDPIKEAQQRRSANKAEEMTTLANILDEYGMLVGVDQELS